MTNTATDMSAQVQQHGRDTTVRSLLDKVGLATLLALEGVTEIAVNKPLEAWTKTKDGWRFHDLPELSFERCQRLAKAVAFLNKKAEFGPSLPMIPSLMPGGERTQINIEPAVTPETVAFTIRIPSQQRFGLSDYERFGTFKNFRATAGYTEAPAEVPLEPHERELLRALHERDVPQFLRLAVLHRLNLVFVGGTGSGKTTLMKCVADLVDPGTRVGTVEDTHELPLPLHKNAVHMFYSDRWPAKECVRASLRMMFDRVYLAELRGDETWDYLTLLNTGHQGGMTSVHANGSVAAYPRIATLIKASEVGQKMDYDYLLREAQQTIDVTLFMNECKELAEIFYDPVRKLKLQRGIE